MPNKSTIRQNPVTKDMTPEQLAEFKETVREARHGNVGNAWNHLPVGGRSYQIEEKTMSDDLGYGYFEKQERQRIKEEQEVLESRQDKRKLIEKYKQYIAKLENRITQIQHDVTMSTAVKQQKIQNCINKINMYKQGIARTEEFLTAQTAKTHELYQKYMKMK